MPEAPLRAVANLVGGYAAGPRVHETPVEDFERLFTLNLRPAFLVTQAALPHLVRAGGGGIVCVSARAALQPFPGAAGYASSKAAVIAFAKTVAAEYRDEGVRCNAILPSVIDTPANRAAQPDADHSRWVAPAEIARRRCSCAQRKRRQQAGAAVPVYRKGLIKARPQEDRACKEVVGGGFARPQLLSPRVLSHGRCGSDAPASSEAFHPL